MAEAFAKIGRDGVITVEEGKTSDTALEFVEGMQFDKGFISPYFVVNTPELKWEQEDVSILLFEKKLSNVREMLPLLDRVAQEPQAAAHHRRRRGERGSRGAGREPAARVARSVRGESARLRRPPQGHDGRHRGADRRQFVSEDRGIALDSMTEAQLGRSSSAAPARSRRCSAMLGHADQVMVDKENCTIIVEPGQGPEDEARRPREDDPHADGSDRERVR